MVALTQAMAALRPVVMGSLILALLAAPLAVDAQQAAWCHASGS
jgi:hypothetical protein